MTSTAPPRLLGLPEMTDELIGSTEEAGLQGALEDFQNKTPLVVLK